MDEQKRHITFNELISEWPPLQYDPIQAEKENWDEVWRFNPETVDWKNSWVIYGSSAAYGSELSEEHSLANQLSRLLGEPVVNCACPGSGIQHHVLMQSLVRYHHGPPKGEIICWTMIYKWLGFEETDRQKTPWGSKVDFDAHVIRHPYKEIFPQIPQQAFLSRLAAKAINSNLIEFTDSSVTQEYWPDLWLWDRDQTPDRAKDGKHCGPLGIEIAAKWCYEQIRSK